MTGTVALTGITGFIGGALASLLAGRGWRVRALSRRPTETPGGRGIEIVPGALEDSASLARLIEGADAIVHCAGLVRARTRADFGRVNGEGTATLAALAAKAANPPRFVYLSSLSAREPQLSAYAASKLAGEQRLAESAAGMPWVVLRPPGVYGPGDRETLVLFRQYRNGLATVPAAAGARFSVICVDDLARALESVLAEPPESGTIAEVHDGRDGGYSWDDLAAAARRHLGRRIYCLRIPRSIMHIASVANAAGSGLLRRAPMITPGKVRELYHRDWVCADNPLSRLTSWRPEIDLDAGFARTFTWYRERGWL